MNATRVFAVTGQIARCGVLPDRNGIENGGFEMSGSSITVIEEGKVGSTAVLGGEVLTLTTAATNIAPEVWRFQRW